MLKLKRQFSLLSLLVLVVQLFAQGPNGSGTYYRNANGQKGKSLKTALFQIISTHKDIGYKPKSVIRISLCRTAKRNPLIFPI